jgi:hypothetical protein
MDSIELLHHFDLYIFRCAWSSAVLKKNFGQSSLIVAVNPILEGDFPCSYPIRSDHLIQSSIRSFITHASSSLFSYSNSISVADLNIGRPSYRLL